MQAHSMYSAIERKLGESFFYLQYHTGYQKVIVSANKKNLQNSHFCSRNHISKKRHKRMIWYNKIQDESFTLLLFILYLLISDMFLISLLEITS